MTKKMNKKANHFSKFTLLIKLDRGDICKKLSGNMPPNKISV